MKELVLKKEDFDLTVNIMNAETSVAQTKHPHCGECDRLLPENEGDDSVRITLKSGKTIDWGKSTVNLNLIFE